MSGCWKLTITEHLERQTIFELKSIGTFGTGNPSENEENDKLIVTSSKILKKSTFACDIRFGEEHCFQKSGIQYLV